MNTRQSAVLLGAAILVTVGLAFSPQAEAKGGSRAHNHEYRHQDNRRHGDHYSYRRNDRRQHSKHHRGGHHDHHRRYRSYGYDYRPHDYCCDSSLVLGTYRPYGFSIYYLD